MHGEGGGRVCGWLPCVVISAHVISTPLPSTCMCVISPPVIHQFPTRPTGSAAHTRPTQAILYPAPRAPHAVWPTRPTQAGYLPVWHHTPHRQFYVRPTAPHAVWPTRPTRPTQAGHLPVPHTPHRPCVLCPPDTPHRQDEKRGFYSLRKGEEGRVI